jgi:DNA invertase Pin-like site-specific DNA recombinase
MKRVAYLRVSTKDQSHSSQRHAVEKYLSAYGIVAEFYEENGSGGSTKDRPIFRQLMREIERGEVSHLYIFKLDRFARNTKDFLLAHEKIEKAGCAFVSISDSLDFSTPVGRMLAQMLAMFAEFEREQIRARVKASYAARRARGAKFGHEPRYFDQKKFELLFRNGTHMQSIANNLGFSKSQLYRIVKGTYGMPAGKLKLG